MQTHSKAPESPQDSLYLPTDISPEQFFQALGRLRKEAQDEIDRLLTFLDRTEPDPDLEPTFGFMNGPAEQDECEDDADFEHDAGDMPEDDPAESGIGDLDGLMEQVAHHGFIGQVR